MALLYLAPYIERSRAWAAIFKILPNCAGPLRPNCADFSGMYSGVVWQWLLFRDFSNFQSTLDAHEKFLLSAVKELAYMVHLRLRVKSCFF